MPRRAPPPATMRPARRVRPLRAARPATRAARPPHSPGPAGEAPSGTSRAPARPAPAPRRPLTRRPPGPPARPPCGAADRRAPTCLPLRLHADVLAQLLHRAVPDALLVGRQPLGELELGRLHGGGHRARWTIPGRSLPPPAASPRAAAAAEQPGAASAQKAARFGGGGGRRAGAARGLMASQRRRPPLAARSGCERGRPRQWAVQPSSSSVSVSLPCASAVSCRHISGRLAARLASDGSWPGRDGWP